MGDSKTVTAELEKKGSESNDQAKTAIPESGDQAENVESEGKSKRKKRPRLVFSPDDDYDSKHSRRKQKKPKRFPFSSTAPDRPCDLLSNGTPFSCDLCKSPYIINRFSKKTLKNRRSKHVPVPQQRRDHITGKVLTLCNACGHSYDRPKKPKKCLLEVTSEEREDYLQECKNWAKKLSEKFNLPNAIHLYCPVLKNRRCACLQKYIEFDVEEESESQRRASRLSAMASEARRLSALKYYQKAEDESDASPQKTPNRGQDGDDEPAASEDSEKTKEKKAKKSLGIGLGNGHKKSEKFASFVLSKRQYLKLELGLCERAAQKILCYSNNFLHKRLKTEKERFRATPMKGKARLGLLPSFNDMAKKRCCVDNCVMMALTHRTLLEEWRRRSKEGQFETRRVIAEMLTPSGCARKNCYNFISGVTGSSRTTIVQVNQQMSQTGGDREPPSHGLKKSSKNKKKTTATEPPVEENLSSTQNSANFLVQHKEQLQQLQQQVTEQQQQLQQQQELQQQLLQQILSTQKGEIQNQSLNLLQQVNNQLNIHIQNTQKGLQQTLHSMGLLMGTVTPGNQSGTRTNPNVGTTRNANYVNTLPSSTMPSGISGSIYQPAGLGGSLQPVGLGGSLQTNIQQFITNQGIVYSEPIQMPAQSRCLVATTEGPVQFYNNSLSSGSNQYGLSNLQQSKAVHIPNANQGQTLTIVPDQTYLGNQSYQQNYPALNQGIQQNYQSLNQQQVQFTSQPVQNQQQIVLHQPVFQGDLSLDQNIITLPSDVVLATQVLPSGEVIHVLERKGSETNNVLHTAANKNTNIKNSTQKRMDIPTNQTTEKVMEVLSNAQIVPMKMPRTVEDMQNLHSSSLPSHSARQVSQPLNNLLNQGEKHQEFIEKVMPVTDAARQSGSSGNDLVVLPIPPENATNMAFSAQSVYCNVSKNSQPVYTATPLSNISETNIVDININSFQSSIGNRNQPSMNRSGRINLSNLMQKIAVKSDIQPSKKMKTRHDKVKVDTAKTKVDNVKNDSTATEKTDESAHAAGKSSLSTKKGKLKGIENQSSDKNPKLSGTSIPMPVLTPEYMNFSLPLSDVITLYTNSSSESQSNIALDQTQLQLSLQINPVHQNGSENLSSGNTVNLGSILIMDQEQNNAQESLIPKTVKDQESNLHSEKRIKGKKSNRNNNTHSRKEPSRIERSQKTSTRPRIASSDSHETEVDNEVRQIFQTVNEKVDNSKSNQFEAQSKPDIYPFNVMVRSDTLIYDQNTENQDSAKMLQRSDTVKLPEEMDKEITSKSSSSDKKKDNTYSRKSNNKKKNVLYQNTILPRLTSYANLSTNDAGMRNVSPNDVQNLPHTSISSKPIILTGNLSPGDKQWLQQLVTDMQKRKM